MPSKNSRAKRRHRETTPKNNQERAKAWTIESRSIEEARHICLYLDTVLGIDYKCRTATVSNESGGNDVAVLHIDVWTLKSLVLEAMAFADEIKSQGLKAYAYEGEIYTVQPLPAASRPVVPVESGTPRLSDHLAPVAMFAGIPVYELPSPKEAERIVRQMAS